jgi:sulfur-oxidizing protein SoxA
MRFRSALLAASLALAPLSQAAAPDAVRAELAARLREKLPGVSPSDYALGAAAFDAELRARVQDNSGAAATVVAAGKALWTRKFKDGRSLSGCFPNGGRRVAQAYPQYDSKLKRVITLEMAVNQCLKAHNEALYDPTDPETMGAVMAYLRSLADGQRAAVRVPAGAEARFEQGRRLYFTRLGQRNYACASCHVQGVGKRFGDVPISPPVGQTTHWPVIRDGKAVTLQARMRECLELMGAAAFPAGSEELNDLEYFLSYLSNGQALASNPYRNW